MNWLEKKYHPIGSQMWLQCFNQPLPAPILTVPTEGEETRGGKAMDSEMSGKKYMSVESSGRPVEDRNAWQKGRHAENAESKMTLHQCAEHEL